MTKGESRPVLSQIREAYSKARELPEGPERDAYLDRIGAADPELLKEVASLLAASVEDDRFLEESFVSKALPKLDDLVGTTVDGRYRILEKLGEGGFGVVFRVEQTEPLRRELALKVIKPGMDSREVIARFESERQALALLDHSNIAQVHDAGATETGRPYFVMELAAGPPITAYCDAKRLGVGERLRLFCQVCAAVQHAHQKGIIHRDLKPSNVVVVEEPTLGGPVPKVIDFGIAKSLQRRLTDRSFVTQQAELIGTPAYMSPEQMDTGSNDLDTRIDVYALGALLYELVTGAQPFDWKTLRRSGLSEAQRIIREVDPPKPSTRIQTLGAESARIADCRMTQSTTLAKSLRGDLDWIVMKAMEKDRDRRYQGVGDLAEDIDRHLKNQPVEAGPPSRTYRFHKYARRHWIGMTAAVGIVAALSIGFILALAGYRQADLERREADAARGRSQEMVGAILEQLQPQRSGTRRQEAIIASAEAAVDYFEKLPAHLRDVESVRAHAQALEHLADAYARGHWALVSWTSADLNKIRDATRRAIELWREVAMAMPDDPEAIVAILLGEWRLVRANMEWIKFDHAEGLQSSRNRLEELENRFPENRSVQLALVHILREQSFNQVNHGRLEEGIPYVQEAQQRLESLLENDPDDIELLMKQVEILLALSSVHGRTGLSGVEIGFLEDALTVSERLLASDPYDIRFLGWAASAATQLIWREPSHKKQIERTHVARGYLHLLQGLDPGNPEWTVKEVWVVDVLTSWIIADRRIEQARTLNNEVFELLASIPRSSYHPRFRWYTLVRAGVIAAQVGDRQSALDYLERLRAEPVVPEGGSPRIHDAPAVLRILWLHAQAKIVTDLEDWEQLERIAKQILAQADKYKLLPAEVLYLPLGVRAHAEGFLGNALFRQGRRSEALPYLEQLSRRFRNPVTYDMGGMYILCRVKQQLAHILQELGRREEAVEELRWVHRQLANLVEKGALMSYQIDAVRSAWLLAQALDSAQVERQLELMEYAIELLNDPEVAPRLTPEEQQLRAQIEECLGR